MNQKELTNAISNGIEVGVEKILWNLTKGVIIAIFIIVIGMSVWITFHNWRYGNIIQETNTNTQLIPKNVDGWGNEYSCFFDNENTPCGKTQFCATHQTREKCYELNGTWELETQARFYQQWYYFDVLTHNPTIPNKINETYKIK